MELLIDPKIAEDAMAKLIVRVKEQFSTNPIRMRPRFESVELGAKKAKAVFSKADPLLLGFEVVSTNKAIAASFEFHLCDMKKGGVLDIQINPDAGLDVTIDGEFALKLRAGVAPLLQAPGKKLDLRIRSAIYKSGEASDGGFTGWVKDSDYEQEGKNWKTTFPKVSDYEIK